ncbi:MAG: DUF692 domain-containing protein [Silvanigrellales bacterium]|nr:DUF692 domain-containing protein [Silvanigrellales bacterium]
MPRALKRDALGIALRPENVLELRAALEKGDAGIDYVEILGDNYLFGQPLPNAHLDAIREHLPAVVHTVGLNILGTEPLDRTYLTKLKALADRVDAPFVTDHLCWTRTARHASHDLLPTPFRHDLVHYAARRAALVQDILERPFGLENVSSYVTFPESDMTEAAFFAAVVGEASCHYLLDINNVFVSSWNNGFDPACYFVHLEPKRLLQAHVAGHETGEGGLLVDTHNRAVCDGVWALHRQAQKHFGSYPLLLEWDAEIPSWESLVAQVLKGRRNADDARFPA